MNKKGFSLIELLAVIVILAVVMLVAVTAVGPMMAKSRKSALATEGLSLIKAAQSAYSMELNKGSSAAFTSTSSVCFSLDYLFNNGYFKKGDSDGYSGSIAVIYTGTGEYQYRYWISNGTYMYLGNYEEDVDPETAIDYTESYITNIQKCEPDTLDEDETTSSLSGGEIDISNPDEPEVVSQSEDKDDEKDKDSSSGSKSDLTITTPTPAPLLGDGEVEEKYDAYM